VHVEAVANIVGRAEILSALFFLLACHLHLSEQLRPVVRIGVVAVLYLLALGAKESAVTLPAVLLVLDLHRHGTTPGALRQVVRNSTPLLLALAVTLGCYLALRQAALGQVLGSAAAPYLYTLSTADRLATAVRLWPEFLRLLFWPRALSAEWGPGTINPATWRDPLFGAGLLLGVTVAAVAWIGWRRARWIWLAVLWFGVTFLPISQIPFPIGVMLAERLLYLPSVALVFIAPAVVSWLSRMPRPAQASGAAVVCLVLALGAWHTWSRTPVWQSEESFAEALHRDRPESYRSLWLTADGYVRQGDLAAAVPLYARAVELTHGYHHNLNINYSSVLLATGRPAEAEVLMRKSLPREPRNPAGYHLLSMSLLQQRQYRYALHVLERGRAVAHMSPVAESRFARTAALAYDALGKPDSARIHYMASTRAR
jgi:Tfp pilus assembly protein PilF